MASDPKKSVGLKGIAAIAGVSLATVSMALSNHPQVNETTKKRIREIARQVGYRRAKRAKRMGETPPVRRFGFVLLGAYFEDEVYLSMLQSLTSAVSVSGDRMELHAIEDIRDEAAVNSNVLDFARQLDGLVLSGYVNKNLIGKLETAAIPNVILGHPMFPGHELTSRCSQIVATDEMAMGELAVRVLMEMGHQRIAFISELDAPGLWQDRWRRGYQIGLFDAGLPVDPALMVISHGDRAAEILLKVETPPTAFIVPDVRIAAAFLTARRILGKPVADDAIIIGGQQAILPRYGLEQMPTIGFDHDRLATVVFAQLRELCARAVVGSTEILVPFEAKHLPHRARV
ncbi:MAG: LacI family DNA-binding transcriptional regulator [Phycisphaeraceae bacterium]|nr:LacI family DNA-binding transcriptional regulator [Phycisphaeraceae bacterium]